MNYFQKKRNLSIFKELEKKMLKLEKFEKLRCPACLAIDLFSVFLAIFFPSLI